MAEQQTAEKFSSKKFWLVVATFVLPEWFVLIMTFVKNSDAGYNYSKWFMGLVALAMFSYLGFNVGQKWIINRRNNGDK